jgi:penicillin amidase
MPLFRLLALIGAALAGVLAVVMLLVAGTVTWVLHTSEPKLGGTDIVPGLAGEVTVVRNAHAVPHIFAGSLDDAYRALGYLHAKDRFFQMDFARRAARGRMAEFAGRSALRTDRLMRTLGLYRVAEAATEAAEPATRRNLDAYADGVNAWLASPHFRNPPELVLGGTDPEPWRPADSVAVGRLMAVLLSGNWRDELLRAEIGGILTPAQMDALWPPEPTRGPATLPASEAILRLFDPMAVAEAIPDIRPADSASNAWVVDSTLANRGKPLRANDPHLGFSAPGYWYLVRIVTPEGDRVGGTLAGQPYVMIGHNGNVAWGLTTTHADTQDLFVEKLVDGAADSYIAPDGPRAFDIRDEIIDVRFGDPEMLTIRTTRHGPVISDLVPTNAVDESHVLALAWPALRNDDRTADALARLNAARDETDVAAALALLDSPIQNVTFATRDGVIGFRTAGRIPMRKAGDGSVPAPGWTGEYDWAGFIPFAELPNVTAPPGGRIVNANNRPVGPDYPYIIGTDWQPAYRAERIDDLLDTRARHDVSSFAAMQLDSSSYAAHDLLWLMIGLAQGFTQDAEAPGLLTRLANWDGTMARNAAEPLLYMAWIRETGRLLYRDELGRAFGHLRGVRPSVIKGMLTEHQEWCDDVTTEPQENCAWVAGRAFDNALALLRQHLGEDSVSWHWGELHKAHFRHPVVKRIPGLRDLFGTAIETDGGPFTINRGTAQYAGGNDLFSHVHGPGLRVVIDLAEPGNSRFITASGQSGHPLSPYYVDTTPIWRDGGSFTLTGSRATLQRDAVAELTLRP